MDTNDPFYCHEREGHFIITNLIKIIIQYGDGLRTVPYLSQPNPLTRMPPPPKAGTFYVAVKTFNFIFKTAYLRGLPG